MPAAGRPLAPTRLARIPCKETAHGEVMQRSHPAVKLFGERLKARGLAPKAVVGACMHKLAMLVFGVLKSGRPFDLKLALPGVDDQDGI